MQKKKRYAGKMPHEQLDRLFLQWTTNAAELADKYPDDVQVSDLLEAFVRAFDAAADWHRAGYRLMLVVAAQPRLPDFVSDDYEYGEAP